MKCPYCSREMKKGVVRGDGRTPVKFMAEGENPGLFYTGQRLTNVRYDLTQFEIQANYCGNCGKRILDARL